MSSLNLVDRAKLFATKCHEGQFRKDGVTPYITHPATVVGFLKRIGINDEDTLAAAWLHDVIEDCHITQEHLSKEFNDKISHIVSQLTRDCSREKYLEKIKNADYSVKIIKLADVVHNCSNLHYPEIPAGTLQNKIQECEKVYFDLSKEISPKFYIMLRHYFALCQYV